MWRIWFLVWWLPKQFHWIMQWLGIKLFAIRRSTVYEIIGFRWITTRQYYEQAGQVYKDRRKFSALVKDVFA